MTDVTVSPPKLPSTAPGFLMPDPLYIDPKLLKSDYHYRFCHTSMQDWWKFYGYEAVPHSEVRTHSKNEKGYASIADVILMKVPVDHWLAVSKAQTEGVTKRQEAAKTRFHNEGEKIGFVETFELDKEGREVK